METQASGGTILYSVYSVGHLYKTLYAYVTPMFLLFVPYASCFITEPNSLRQFSLVQNDIYALGKAQNYVLHSCLSEVSPPALPL